MTSFVEFAPEGTYLHFTVLLNSRGAIAQFRRRRCSICPVELLNLGRNTQFTDRESLVRMIENYIVYYNHQRLQRNLGILTPMQKHELYKAA